MNKMEKLMLEVKQDWPFATKEELLIIFNTRFGYPYKSEETK